MAKVVGRSCDGPKCSTFVPTTADATPDGWIQIRPMVREAAYLEVCSNLCGYELLRERAEADGSLKRRGRPSANALMGDHTDGKHDQDPKDGCPLCEEATAPIGS